MYFEEIQWMISALNAFFNPYPNMTGDSPTDEKLPQYDYTKAAKNDDDGEFYIAV